LCVQLAEKAAAKYDPKMEAEARDWLEAVLGEKLEGSFQEALKSGIALCNAVIKLKPDVIKAPSRMAAPFKQMENISNYLKACTALGQPAYESFQTVDLYEGKNMLAVVTQIHGLGRLAQKIPGFSGPSLGPKQATANHRDFSEEVLNAGKSAQTFLGKGSTNTPAEGMKTAEHLGNQIVKTADPALAGLGTSGAQTFLGKGSSDTQGAHMSTAAHLDREIVQTPSGSYATVAKPDVSDGASMVAGGGAARLGDAQYNVREDTLYGLDRELAEKAAAKYDVGLEGEARAWMEAVLGHGLGGGTFHEALKDGVALCNLVRKLKPDVIKAPSSLFAPFKQMENIGNYLKACATLGQSDYDIFQTVALYENKDMGAVVRQIHSLGRLAQKLPGYSGPGLGPKEATANHRDFSEEQLQAAKNAPTFLGKGSHGTPAEDMSRLELGKQQVRSMGLEKEGLGTGGEQTFQGGGAANIS
jgi:hypothetical protein